MICGAAVGGGKGDPQGVGLAPELCGSASGCTKYIRKVRPRGGRCCTYVQRRGSGSGVHAGQVVAPTTNPVLMRAMIRGPWSLELSYTTEVSARVIPCATRSQSR
jgi:hypothetical protein